MNVIKELAGMLLVWYVLGTGLLFPILCFTDWEFKIAVAVSAISAMSLELLLVAAFYIIDREKTSDKAPKNG